MAIILSINSGSSSLKISAYELESSTGNLHQLAECQVSALTHPPARLKFAAKGVEEEEKKVPEVASDRDALSYIIDTLIENERLTEVRARSDVKFVCHRVVHGGEYRHPRVINRETKQHIEELVDLAPLHNTAALDVLQQCHAELPSTTNIAVFDSSFHASIPAYLQTYAIDQEKARKGGLHKYGFHGISYSYITRAVADFLGTSQANVDLIALHLGAGASVCAIKNGKSLDTSMGLTPLAGLPGATRSGDIDPCLVFHLDPDAAKPAPEFPRVCTGEKILNKQSGWQALTGTADFSHIVSSTYEDCRMAYKLFVNRILDSVGSYFVKLDGRVDALVFAGGIGEKSARLREDVANGCACLGMSIDEQKNREPMQSRVTDVGKSERGPRLLVCQTDEQLEMARQCSNMCQSEHSNPVDL